NDSSFYVSIFFYGIINLNVFLAIILSFLVVRNIAKLLVERKRGVFGSNLRTKLVATLLVFALAPTVIIFYVSTRFINESFDEWFGSKVRETMQSARDAGGQIYLQDQRRLEGIARVASSKIKVRSPVPVSNASATIEVLLDGFELEYGVHSVRVYERSSKLVWSSVKAEMRDHEPIRDRQLVGSILGRFATRPGLVSSTIVDTDNGKDIVRASVPLRLMETGELAGILVVEERFEMPFLKSLETIIEAFSRLKPGAQLVRVSYLILMTVMTLMIVFASVWFGFRVARTIIGPIQILADATREVALGNYAVTLNPQFDDETGQLMKSFNIMTSDLQQHRKVAKEAQYRLELTNEELERRRRYMEIVFSNIAAGVISTDALGNITAFNQAAINLLEIQVQTSLVGTHIKGALGEKLTEAFWEQVVSMLQERNGSLTREVDLRSCGLDLALFVAATAVKNQDGEDLGVVVVFDDVTHRVKQQRVLAWREVASKIAHEIKNPITPIKLAAERLLRRYSNKFEGDDKAVFDGCVSSILGQVENLRTLVNEFGKFARLPQVQLERRDLAEIVRKSVDFFIQGYPDVEFNLSIQAHLPPADLDAEQFNRALLNILGNSVDSIIGAKRELGGVVDVKVFYDSLVAKFYIEIADNGTGIPEQIKDRVFDPYVSTKAGGTGLGLAITSQIISEHGGYVRIVSTSLEGTLLKIELPRSTV
ncbi:MAG: ATP-binding protein, partial [Proteobacteria bacterium]|nr:ATP-binding protein [Pseudomonadota bacterium]